MTYKVRPAEGLPVPSLAARQTDIVLPDFALYQTRNEKGAAGGYAPLNSSSKVPAANLSTPDSLFPQGAWNASTNTPTIPAASGGNQGDYWIVAVAGTTTVSGISSWSVGDWIINLSGSAWEKIPYSSTLVTTGGWTVLLGLNGDGVTDDFATLQAAATTGLIYWLPGEGKKYRISQCIVFANGGGFVSDGTATIYGTAADFDNTTVIFADPTKIGASNACFIYAHGLLSTPWTQMSKFTFKGIILQSEVSDGRNVEGLVVRNVAEADLEYEAYGFPLTVLCRAESNGPLRLRPYFHDCTSNNNLGNPTLAGLYGFVQDNELVNGVLSFKPVIENPQIHRLTVGVAIISAHGYETDGITCSRVTAEAPQIIGGHITDCGEGIDIIGNRPQIVGVTIERMYNFGIKAGHGSLSGVVTGCRVNDSGIANLLLYATVNGGASKWNVTGNNFDNVDPDLVWNTFATTACIKIDSDSGANKCEKSLFSANSCRPGANGNYAIVDTSTGVNRFLDNEEEVGSNGTYSNFFRNSSHRRSVFCAGEEVIADDTAISFAPPNLIGTLIITTTDGGAMLWVRADGTVIQDLGTRYSQINLSTGILAGTTGTDAKWTISTHTNHLIYIENRMGSARNIAWRWFPYSQVF